jgi:LruC domain-containing protein
MADAADLFPCDPGAAGAAFAPAEGAHALLLFEDQWPAQGDLDFNDLVLAYNYAFRVDGQGRVARVRVTLEPLAIGGVYTNGLGLHLPVPRGAVASVRRTVAGVSTDLMLAAGDAELTVTVSSNLRELFGGAAGTINSAADKPRQAGQAVVVEVVFTQPVALPMGSAPYDLFLFRTADPTHEIHRPEFAGTARMNAALFGTADDGSSPARHFVDTRGLPFALGVPVQALYPREAVDIAQLFPRILDFAATGGASSKDYYAAQVVAAHAYVDSAGQAALPPAAIGADVADKSCAARGASGMALVPGGGTMSSAHYMMTGTLSPGPAAAPGTSSANYQLRGGVIGATRGL